MRLSVEAVAEIKALKSLYSASDVARHYSVETSTVTRIWSGERHKNVVPTEAPVIHCNRVPEWLVKDVLILWDRKYSPTEIARTLRITTSGVMNAIPAGE